MTTPADWQKTNEAYLVAALAWLRMRLERLAECEPPAPLHVPALPPKKPQKSRFFMARWLRGWFGEAIPHESEISPMHTIVVHPVTGALSDEEMTAELAKAETAMTMAEQNEMPPALTILSQRFGLSRFEQQLLLLCVARDLDTRIDKLCARAQHDANRPFPTYALAMVMFEDPLWDALSPDRPLRYWNLIEINQPGTQPLTTSALRADERIVNYVKGLNHLDDRVARWLTPLAAHSAEAELPASQQRAVELIQTEIEHGLIKQQLPIVQLLGRDTAGKKFVTMQVANHFRRLIYLLNAEALPAQGAEAATFIRLLQRETQLLPLTIYVDAHEVDKAAEGRAAALKRFLTDYEGLIFLDALEAWPCADRQAITVNIVKPTADEQYAVWVQELGESSANFAEQLAGQFSL
jgi:hypothetical protein